METENDSLSALRLRVVALASVRFDRYFHNSTGTHIIRQVEGTELGTFPVKGFGEFADEAHDDYVQELTMFVRKLTEQELREAERRLGKSAPTAKKKYELQVELPEQVNVQLAARARAGNLTVATYVQQLLMRALPDHASVEVARRWYDSIKTNKLNVEPGAAGMTTVMLPLGSVDIQKLTAITSVTGGLPSEIIQKLIAAEVGDRASVH